MPTNDQPTTKPNSDDERLWTLRDGETVRIRRIRPDDGAALSEGLARMSPESRYRRFLSPTERLTASQVDYLTHIDQHDHLAWGAAEPDEGPGLGVARCVRLADAPNVAEAAVAVVDTHHGKGLGTLLLGVLASDAMHHGIDTFRGYMLADNSPAMALFEQLGAVKHGIQEGMLVFDMSIAPDRLPDTPAGRVFKAVAQGDAPAPLNPFKTDD